MNIHDLQPLEQLPDTRTHTVIQLEGICVLQATDGETCGVSHVTRQPCTHPLSRPLGVTVKLQHHGNPHLLTFHASCCPHDVIPTCPHHHFIHALLSVPG